MLSTQSQSQDEITNKDQVIKSNNHVNKDNVVQNKAEEQIEIKSESTVKNQNQDSNKPQKALKRIHKNKSGNISTRQSNPNAKSKKNLKKRFYDNEIVYLSEKEE